MTLDELARALEGVRWLCMRNPEHARRRIAELNADPVNFEMPHKVRQRVWKNIGDALYLIDDAPAVLATYLHAAAVDIRAAARLAEENPEEPMTWEKAAKILNISDDEDI